MPASPRAHGRETQPVEGARLCTHCGRVKPLHLFLAAPPRRDGTPRWQSWCRNCKRIECGLAYHEKPGVRERILAFKRAPEAQARCREANRRYYHSAQGKAARAAYQASRGKEPNHRVTAGTENTKFKN